jgi:hypothetical protein
MEGFLIYLKPTMTDDCAIDLRAYRERHPSFPHEPTTNQFFGEAQFEAYREHDRGRPTPAASISLAIARSMSPREGRNQLSGDDSKQPAGVV